MFVAGTIVDKQGPVLKTIYDQMPEPKWVISMGVCASSGGFYRSYHVMQGIDEIIPVDVYVPGCPPAPEALVAAVMKIQERIQKGVQAKEPQGAHRHGAPGDGFIDRRARRAAWEKDDTRAARAGQAAARSRAVPRPEQHGRKAGAPWLARRKSRRRPRLRPAPTRPPPASSRTAGREGQAHRRLARRPLDHGRPQAPGSRPAPCCAITPSWTSSSSSTSAASTTSTSASSASRSSSTLYSVSKKHHVRLKAAVPESRRHHRHLTGVYKGASWFEREAWDLYGIVFKGHPNLVRILTHKDFVGHGMRKDYPTARRHILKEPEAWLLKPPTGEHTVVNIGPSHPAMHGAFRVQAVMDGETIVDAEAEIGYMHRNFEKMAEERTYWQIIPYTDRLNYCSSFMNGHGWALAVEKLLGVPAPPRAEAIRVILSEFSRIMDHFVCIGANIVDLGAITPFFMSVPRARGHLRPPRSLLRRAPDRLLRAHRRPGRGRARGLRRPLPRRSSRASTHVHRPGRTSSSRATASS